MKQTNKIKAFTLSEMIVVLILTSIVVALAFTVLSLIQKHMFSIEQNFRENTTINLLETSLSLDFNRSGYINYDENERELWFKTELDSINYRIQDEYLIKNLDTFRIKPLNVKLFFNGEKVTGGDIDAIKLSFSETVSKDIFVYKINDANIHLK